MGHMIRVHAMGQRRARPANLVGIAPCHQAARMSQCSAARAVRGENKQGVAGKPSGSCVLRGAWCGVLRAARCVLRGVCRVVCVAWCVSRGVYRALPFVGTCCVMRDACCGLRAAGCVLCVMCSV